jgi:hypothetical protein
MSVAALFTIAKLWKQPRCPASENVVFVQNVILLSSKEDGNFVICK